MGCCCRCCSSWSHCYISWFLRCCCWYFITIFVLHNLHTLPTSAHLREKEEEVERGTIEVMECCRVNKEDFEGFYVLLNVYVLHLLLLRPSQPLLLVFPHSLSLSPSTLIFLSSPFPPLPLRLFHGTLTLCNSSLHLL